MIKKWNQFLLEFVESGGYIDARMQEIKDLLDGISSDENSIVYEWENKDDHRVIVSFSTGDLSASYDFDIDDLMLVKTAGESVDFETPVESIEEGIERIESDIKSILSIEEAVLFEARAKAQRYKGRKIPGKYLTKNPGKMKKEIDRFVGKKEYKKDWDADYVSGKGGEGKRVKTKKSAATKAYQRMFGKKED